MKKGRNFYASLLLFTAALCPLSGSPAFGTGPVKAAESTVSVPKKLLASVKKGYVKLRWSKTAGGRPKKRYAQNGNPRFENMGRPIGLPIFNLAYHRGVCYNVVCAITIL